MNHHKKISFFHIMKAYVENNEVLLGDASIKIQQKKRGMNV